MHENQKFNEGKQVSFNRALGMSLDNYVFEQKPHPNGSYTLSIQNIIFKGHPCLHRLMFLPWPSY